ncbi:MULTISPECIES: OmpA family protein [unclassified Shewanella]|uniref:MotY family protein n=1 Tax=unclassified Shewanella TaxID=196818 RepID=UPI001BBC40B8|nr:MULTISPECIES: OmpA family protein [unclassified Shewanella]GIU14796.1 sodium-type flagellar protein MotY [Shewanella sp. MBTL60-112-B1]GIU37678.1 sodium-type flagellar protein MotY [Shewanella sp. MBTL60-112-B2]
MKKSVYILICLIFICTNITNNALAAPVNYQTPFEKAHWEFSGDLFGCEISHRVQSFGTLQLSATPGEPLALSLQADWLSLNNTQSQAWVVPASWQEKPHQRIATTSLNWFGAKATSQHQTAAFLEALEQGHTWQVAISAADNSHYLINASPVSTQSVANQFRLCRQQLLPKPFTYLRRLEFLFAPSSSLLNADHEQDLYAVYRYLQADPSIVEVLVDGHADASGDHLANLVLSKERSDEVVSRLIELGVSAKMIQTRHHGTRTPVASNNSTEGRELNRRVTLRLVKSEKNSVTPALRAKNESF